MTDIDDLQYNHILIFAMRYALDRNTTAPSVVVDHIISNWENFDAYDRKQITKEIEEALRWKTHFKLDIIRKWEEVLNLEVE